MMLAQTIIATPLVMGITAAAVASVPPDLVLQVRSLGASPWQARRALLREARPGVLTAIAAGFGRVIAEVGAAQLVGGDIVGHTRVLTTAIVLETRKGEFVVAMMLGGWLIGLALLVNLVGTRLQGRPVP
jgi:tungstate transport system permease protein